MDNMTKVALDWMMNHSYDQYDNNALTAAVVIGCIVVAATSSLLWYKNKTKAPPIALDPVEFKAFPLIKKEILSHDTRRFTFALPSPHHQVGLPVGQHITLKFTDSTDGKSHQRSYTPVSSNSELGKVSFCIKVYKAGVHPKFPNGGKVSQHLDSLALGDTMLMRGPKGHLTWTSGSHFTIQLSPRKPMETRSVTHLNMICGGTGITPMLQVLHAIFDNPNDQTKIKMIYANQTPDDILVREELETLSSNYPDRFSLCYTVDRHEPKDHWNHCVGFVTADMIQNHLFVPPQNGVPTTRNNKIQTFMCGPPPMIKFACLPALKELNFTEQEWFVF